MNIWSFLKSELTSEQVLDYKESEFDQKRENVYVFLRIPLALEKFMFYGFLQCADSFIYICSLLPLRIITSIFLAFGNPFALSTKYDFNFKYILKNFFRNNLIISKYKTTF